MFLFPPSVFTSIDDEKTNDFKNNVVCMIENYLNYKNIADFVPYNTWKTTLII